MKRVSFLIVLVSGLFLMQSAPAQGTPYLSSLGGSSIGSNPIGSNSWWAEGFLTGTNSAGYTLNSVELLMAAATGSPGDLGVSLYSFNLNTGPANSIATLDGRLKPASAGVYAYIGSGVTLSPNTIYAIVLTAETPLATGAFRWRTTREEDVQRSDGWAFNYLYYDSNDGLSWNYHRFAVFQMAIYATAVPEPAAGVLLGLGLAGLGLWRRRPPTPYAAWAPYAASTPVYNLQYDGFTTNLTAQIDITAGVTNHIKIAIADYAGASGEDDRFDTAVFLKAQISCP